MKKVNPATSNFLDEKDDHFAGLGGTRDVVGRKLREDKVGASMKHTATISQKEEAQLWSEGVLGLSSPRALLNAVFFFKWEDHVSYRRSGAQGSQTVPVHI